MKGTKTKKGARLITLIFFGMGVLAFGQGYQSTNRPAVQPLLVSSTTVNRPAGDSARTADISFIKTAKSLNIPAREINTIKGSLNGYYLVAGVFSSEANASRFKASLRKRGLQPESTYNPGDHKHYVYLAYYQKGKAALDAVISKIGGKYEDLLWIMQLTGGKPRPQNAVENARRNTAAIKAQRPVEDFKEAARRNNLPVRNVKSLPGVVKGYYLIAGVFGEEQNARKLMARLDAKGLNPSYFYNSSRAAFYVHLGRHAQWQEAIALGSRGMNGKYREPLWILGVESGAAIKEKDVVKSLPPSPGTAFPKDILPLSNHSKLYRTSSHKAVKDPPSVAKLIEKADSYFEKMWYAEAAELYELAIGKSESPGFEIIRKAGDSHYFNTNMERAYFWYDRLFDEHKDEMSSENLFKYAHALKGMGKYSRAKRLMRLYNRKLKAEDSHIPSGKEADASREVLMDQIMESEQYVEIKNLDINSKYSDFGPMFYNDNEVVFASAVDSAFFSTRRYKWNNQPYLDLYVAKINEESDQIKDAVKFSKKVNTKYHEAGVTFSPDHNTMYFTRNNYGKKLKRDKQGINHLKIYQSIKVDGQWTEAVELPFNSDSYSTGHPALSPDGRQLYFVSDMPGSIGGTDLFVVDVLEDGSFSEPRNLGPEINTDGKEMFPFINENKLYFSSNGHVGLGGLDIFEVAFDGTDGFLEVRNLGRPYNSNQDDFSFIINEETQKGYFASNRRGGKGDDDIYSFRKPVLEEVNNNAIAGVITELVSGEVLPEALVVLLDENNRKLKEVVAGEDGSFIFEELSGDTRYVIRSQKTNFDPVEQPVATRDNETVEVAIAMQRLDERIAVEEGVKKLRTDMIYFDFDQSYIRKDAALELDKLVGVMNEYPGMVIRIESHTDSRGPAAYNKYLSDKRAKASRDYLIKQGIAARRIESATGYGEERLLNECNGRVRCSEEKHQLNRRSEFIIVDM